MHQLEDDIPTYAFHPFEIMVLSFRRNVSTLNIAGLRVIPAHAFQFKPCVTQLCNCFYCHLLLKSKETWQQKQHKWNN
jgi:hypothetical protein